MHRTNRTTHRGGALALVAFSLLGWLAVPGVPAAADHEPPPASHDAAGSGSVEGTELVEEQEGFPCFRVTRHLFGLRGAGTYEGRTATGGPVVYRGQVAAGGTLNQDGPLQVQVENTEAYYHSPFGTHGTETGGGAGCSPSTVATPVPASFRVFASEGTVDSDGDRDVDVLTGAAWVYRLDALGAKVPCVAHGTYARGTAGNPTFGDTRWVAEWTLDEACVVVGNELGTPGTGSAPPGTFHTQHGVHEPCFGDASAGDCPKNMRSEYRQFLPKPGPFLTLTGPASAVVGCDRPVTVNARLTVSGVATANVPVTFTVAGPAPSVPPTGAGITGADGRAAFTFSAGAPGDYVVTAKVTSEGQERVATHTVRFIELPPLSIILSGPAQGQTEDPTTVRATVRDACSTLSGAIVTFSVAWVPQDQPWTGQATPPSGSGTTDANGEVTFSFSGDRAGSYTVTATTSLGPQQASATHTADLAINTLARVDSIPLGVDGETTSSLSAMDPAGANAYFATGPGFSRDRIVKFDLVTFERVDVLMVPGGGISSLVIDPGGHYAYVGSFGGSVAKIDLATFELAGSLALPPRPDGRSADPVVTLIDPAGDYAYVGSRGSYVSHFSADSWYTAQVLKIDLDTFALVGTLDLDLEEESSSMFPSALMDPDGASAYFPVEGELGTRVVKIDLVTFQRAGHATLPDDDESSIRSGVIDPAGDFAYYGTTFDSPGRIVKLNLRTMTRVDAITLNVDRTEFGPYSVDRTEDDLYSAVMDPAGRFAYFVTRGTIGSAHPAARDVPTRVIRIDLSTFTRAASVDLPPATENITETAVIDPSGTHAYLGTSRVDAVDRSKGPPHPGFVAKVRLNRPPNPALAADAEAFTTDFETLLTVPAPGVLEGDTHVDGDPLVAGQASDPAGGRVVLDADGSLTYTPDAGFSGTDTFTYTASDGIDYSAPATVSVTVDPPQGLTGSAFGYYADVSLFGGPSERRGFGQPVSAPATAASPSVFLPAEGSATPISAYDANGAAAQYGPAVIFGGRWPEEVAAGPPSGPLTATTQGTMTAGGAGTVTSSAKVELHPTPVAVRCSGAPAGTTGCTAPGGVGPGPLVADEAHSTCTANKSGATASARFVNGVVETKYDPDTQLPVEFQPIPNPLPEGYTVEGTIDHVGDSFRIVFNEQVVSAGGARVTVNAAHMYLLGPTAVGEVVIGQSVCGAPLGANAAPAAGDDAYTTVAGRPLTVAAPGVLANDADPDGDVLSSRSVSDPAAGAVALDPDGSFTYTPDPGFVGTDAFTYVADDGFGDTDTATVTVTVTNAVPVAGDDAYTTAGTPLTVPAPGLVGNDTDADGHAVTAGSASAPANGTLTVNANGSFTYTPDPGFVGTDTFTYVADDGFGGNDTANVAVTVTPPPPVGDTRPTQLSVSDLSVAEGDSGTATATFTVTRAGNTAGPSTVKYKTNGGTATAGSDYTPVSLTALSFGAGETTKTVNVAVTGDSLPETNETFKLVLSAPTGAVLADASGVATVGNDDGAAFLAVSNVTVSEGDSGSTLATFTVTRSGNTNGPSSVKYRTNTGTAGAGDFTAIPLTTLGFAPGDTTMTVTVNVTGDTVEESNETFTLALSAPVGATLTDTAGTATIVNDEGTIVPGPSTFLSVDNVLVHEGSTGTTPATFTVTRSGNTGVASTIKYKTSGGNATPGSDYTAITTRGTLSFNAGETTKTVPIDVAGDGLPEADDTFNLTLSTPTGAVIADAAGTATIVNDDGAAYLAVDNVAVNEGDADTTQVTFTVTRTGNTTGASSVNLKTSGGTATAGSDYTAIALTTVDFGADETTKTVTLDITGDTVKESNETVNLALITPGGATVSDTAGTATILNDDDT